MTDPERPVDELAARSGAGEVVDGSGVGVGGGEVEQRHGGILAGIRSGRPPRASTLSAHG